MIATADILIIAAIGFALMLVLPIVAFLYAAVLRARVVDIEDRLARVERWMRGEAPAAAAAPASAPPPDAAPGTGSTQAAGPMPALSDAALPSPAQAPTPPVAGAATATALSSPAAQAPTPVSAAAPASPPLQTAAPGSPPAPAPAPPSAPAQAAAPAPDAAAPDVQPEPLRLETRIGARWMLYAGVSTLVIGVGLFIRYAFVNAWITEPLRVATGLLAGALLIMGGRRFAALGHERFGVTVVGGGVAAWYLAAWAALILYRLVDAATGFAMFTVVTAFAAFQADRLRAQPLAMMAIAGGFLTPFLVVGGDDAQLVLFTYVALLVGAIVYLAHRRDWPALNLTSFLLTGLTVAVWCVFFYEPDAYLRTELFFTLYAGLFLWVWYRSRSSAHPFAPVVRGALATTPLWYHAASLAILGDHWLAFLVYLIAVTGVGVAAAARSGAMWARAGLWVLVAGPLFGWTAADPGGTWLVPAAVTWIAVAGLHAAAQLELLRRKGGPLHAADVVLVPVNGLGLAFGLQALLDPHLPGATALATAALAVAWWAVAAGVRRIDPGAAMHVLVLAAALAAAAVGLHLDGAWGALASAALAGGLAWLGIRERRAWIRGVGAVLLAAAALVAMAAQTAPLPAVHAVLLNRRALLGLFIVAVLVFVAWLHRRRDDPDVPHRRPSLATAVVGANALLLFTLSMEIDAFWEFRRDVAADAELARQMMLSATWAAYAAALTAAGIRQRYAPVRYLALVVFAATVLKVFLVDFSQLDSVYRIASSVVLGLLLLAASYLYQRQSDRTDGAADAPRAAPPAPSSAEPAVPPAPPGSASPPPTESATRAAPAASTDD